MAVNFNNKRQKKMAKKNKSLNAKNSISASGELLLYGEIGDYWDEMDALSIVRQLEYLDPSNISVRIHSTGGNIMEGLAIYNALKQSKAYITVYIDGLAASMATVVAMSGDKIIMPSNALMMIHKPNNYVSGTAEDMRKIADSLDQFESSILTIYETRMTIDREAISEMLIEEKLLSADRCIELGLADELSEPIQAAASINLNEFDKASQNKLKGLFSYAANVAQKPEEAPMTEEEKKAAAAAKKATEAKNKAKIDAEKAAKEAEELKAKNNLDAQAVANSAIATERKRASDIRAIGAQASLSDDAINELIDSGASVGAAQSAALDAVAKRDAEFTPRNHIRVDTDTGAIRLAMSNALMHRADKSVKLTEEGREFVGKNLLSMAEAMIGSTGLSTSGMYPNDIAAKAMLTTSDFPLILADVANKTLRQGYEAAPRTFQPFTRQTSASDFKNINRPILGEASALEKVNEKGEFTYGEVKESSESYKLETFGKIIPITRQVIINDDLDAISNIPQRLGVQAAELESNTMWGLITANAALSDGVALFHATHKNLGTAGALSETTLAEALKKFRKQVGLDGKTPLNLTPAFLIVPAALEVAALKLLSSVIATASGDVNVFSGSMQLIVEPRLDASSATAWYISASTMLIDTIEYAYLTGESGVYIETEQGFDVDGMKIKARLDFGAGVIDHRGLFKNAGA